MILEEENIGDRTKNNLDFIDRLYNNIINTNNLEVFRFILYTYQGIQTNIDRTNAILDILKTEGTDLYKMIARNIYLVIRSLALQKLTTQVDINTIQLILTALNTEMNASYHENITNYPLRLSRAIFTSMNCLSIGSVEDFTFNARNMRLLSNKSKKNQLNDALLYNTLAQLLLLLTYYLAMPNQDPNFKLAINTQHARILILLFQDLFPERIDTIVNAFVPESEIDNINQLSQQIKHNIQEIKQSESRISSFLKTAFGIYGRIMISICGYTI